MFWRFVSGHLAVLTIIGAIAAYAYPPFFLVFRDWFLWCFAATMFALGLVLEPGEAREALRSPGRIAIGVVAQFTIMPLLGFAAGTVALAQGMSPTVALGFVIVGCAPGAMASNVITYLAGGAVAFSVAMTMIATLLSPLVTPALVAWLGGHFLTIPFWPMMRTILVTVALPLAFGMVLRPRLGRLEPMAREIAPGIAAIAIVIICSYAVAANQGRIAGLNLWMLVLVVLVNGLGYLLGWMVGGLARFDVRHRLTLAIEIGMQNAGLGVALALKHFAPDAALPGALFAVWCIITAAGMTRVAERRTAAVAAV